ncbi:Ligand-binding SRPBCC domain-containing protein [Alteribacillus persepolensis]|uniref:Ligand-binding SRPBCC domain-containing protein n=1 Tax=Alteribacillus persepolensis TaxID=568899 RepID=A0A1G7YCM3_9BACI|nr:hypothetical protein [Alteribacillus persepolensis]SDG94076.1 Ligand-binding SRPBCC domain-containing protein [Alteribacillus persepolensis]
MFNGQFYDQTIINADIWDVWSFFKNPQNIVRLTHFPVVSIESVEQNKTGTIITLQIDTKVKNVYWQAKITDVKPPRQFIDVGERMPYPLTDWKHVHSFEQWGELVCVTDTIMFESKWPAWLIKQGLKAMFTGRKKYLRSHFS